jgi:hypothetical protein
MCVDIWKNEHSEHFYQSDTSLIDALGLAKFLAKTHQAHSPIPAHLITQWAGLIVTKITRFNDKNHKRSAVLTKFRKTGYSVNTETGFLKG